MKRTILAMTGLVLAALGARAEGVKWETSYDAAVKLAKESGKPIHLHFWATWCGPCVQMEKEVFADEASSKYLNDNFVNVHVDVDQNQALSEKWKVSGIPDSRIVDVSGKDPRELSKIVGYGRDFMTKVKAVGEITAVEKALTANPKDFPTVFKAADVYMNLGRAQEAADLIGKLIDAETSNAGGQRVQALYRLGLALSAVGDDERKEAAWAEAGKLDPGNSTGFIDDIEFARCQRQINDEDYLPAQTSFSNFLKRFPDSEHVSRAKFLQGVAQFYGNKLEEAVSTFNDVIRSYPGSDDAKDAEKALKLVEKKLGKEKK